MTRTECSSLVPRLYWYNLMAQRRCRMVWERDYLAQLRSESEGRVCAQQVAFHDEDETQRHHCCAVDDIPSLRPVVRATMYASMHSMSSCILEICSDVACRRIRADACTHCYSR